MRILFIIVFIFSCSSVYSQKAKAMLDSLKHKELNLILVPSITIAPEVGVMYGMFVDYYYNTAGKKDTLTRPSLSFIDLQLSTRNQMIMEVFSSVYTKNEKYYLFIKAGYYDDFEQYWGNTKPQLSEDNYLMATYKKYQVIGRFTKNLGNDHFLGIGYQYNNFFNTSFNPTKFSEFIPVSPNSNVFGTGLVYSFDKRDNQFSPTKGHYIDVSAYKMFDLTKSTSGYYLYNFDLRKYFEKKRHVLANQFLLSTTSGNVPVFEKFRLGGPNLMRGMFKGRYRDDNLWIFQTEYRYQISPKIKLAYFASVGNTSPEFRNLFNQEIHFGHGIGARLRINKKKKIYAKFDAASSNGGPLKYYLRLGDSF